MTDFEFLSFAAFLFLRSPDGIEGQPPALPPKQLSRKTLSQIIQAHSQQSLLDNHLNEMYDVPVNTDKTTVSAPTQLLASVKVVQMVSCLNIKMSVVVWILFTIKDTDL